MSTLETRLTQHLAETAALAEPSRDLAGVFAGERRRAEQRSGGRRWMPAAAVGLVLCGIIALFALADRSPSISDEPTVPPTPTPTSAATPTLGPDSTPVATVTDAPSGFPVLEQMPAGLSATASVQRFGDGWTSSRTEALIGRDVDGALIDAVQIIAQNDPFDISSMQDRTPTQTSVMGEPATVHDRSTTNGNLFIVEWGSDPYFVAIGEAPLVLLERVEPNAVAARSGGGSSNPPEVEIGALPLDFEVIAAPQMVTGGPTLAATLSIGADNIDVSVGTQNWLIDMAVFQPLRRVEVNGEHAWTFLSAGPTQDITWQVDDSTYVYVKINDGTNAAGALELANALRFVDFETWSARYEPDVIGVPATTPISEPEGS